MDKEFGELNINAPSSSSTKIVKKEKANTNNYKVVVGTFKYKNSAEKQLKLIQQKYPKTTNNKEAKVVSMKVNGRQLYESRFQFFTKKDANNACSRLKKYKRDCFIRG